jgi:hypothetical protein
MKSIVRKSIGLFAFGALGLLGQDANANVSSAPGSSFHAHNSSQLTYVTGSSYAQLHNTSSSYVDVVGQIPYQSSNELYASVAITNLTSCQATVTNGVGNGAWVGPTKYGQTGSLTWQTLDLGAPPLLGGTSLIVHCILEPGGYIGIAYQ